MLSDLHTWYNCWDVENKNRKAIFKDKLCHFGIKALDDAMPFIQKNDLIVIGADSGVGKSELAINISMKNAFAGRKVALYYLEGGDEEAIARVKYNMINKKLFDTHHRYMNYSDFRCNNVNDPVVDEIEKDIYCELKMKLRNNLWIYRVDTGFTIKNLMGSLFGFHNLENALDGGSNEGAIDIDLIVLDHLQYFDLHKNEIEETTNIIKELKMLADQFKIPVVLISHLRKKSKDRGMPDQEDFYGTSNIPKIATCAVVICSDKSSVQFSKCVFPTFMRFVKSRTGLRSNYVIKCNFDLRSRSYYDDYEVFYLNANNMIAKEPMRDENLPDWAGRGK